MWTVKTEGTIVEHIVQTWKVQLADGKERDMWAAIGAAQCRELFANAGH